jgi:16S rRNA C967 or C1407 C5-methylase (RsmB/RsmF family)
VARWLQRYGPDDTVTLMEWNNTPPSLVLQPAREDDAMLEARWRAAGLEPRRATLAGWLSPARKPAEVPGFAEGAFLVQDPAHALVAAFRRRGPGHDDLRCVRGTGGKSIALGRNGGMVVSGDRKLDRVRRLAQNLARAGSGREHAVVADALHPPLASADIVLLDAPCLGTGTFARHPDARWKVSAEALLRLARRQGELLQACADVVRRGGWLVLCDVFARARRERKPDRGVAGAGRPLRARSPEMPCPLSCLLHEVTCNCCRSVMAPMARTRRDSGDGHEVRPSQPERARRPDRVGAGEAARARCRTALRAAAIDARGRTDARARPRPAAAHLRGRVRHRIHLARARAAARIRSLHPRRGGHARDQAEKLLGQAGFKTKRAESRQHPTYDEGKVIWQDPAAGTVLPEGTPVTLTVSDGIAPYAVPDVSRLPLELAAKVIEASGFRMSKVDTVRSSGPAGVVVEVRPAIGSVQPAGTSIQLVISSGKPALPTVREEKRP